MQLQEGNTSLKHVIKFGKQGAIFIFLRFRLPVDKPYLVYQINYIAKIQSPSNLYITKYIYKVIVELRKVVSLTLMTNLNEL